MANGLARSFQVETEPYESSLLNRLGAYATGISNVPVDIFRYSGIGANALLNKVGLRDDKTAEQVHSAFVDMQNPLDFNDYATKEPFMYTLGNVVGNGLTAGKVAKTIAGPTTNYGTKGLAAAFTTGAVGEGLVEPAMDNIYISPKETHSPSYQEGSVMASELSQEDIDRLAQIESGSKGYTAHNTRSGAYGKYQFIPSTAAAYAKRLGLEGDEWKTPENQDRMFAEFTKDNARQLERKGLPTDLFHIYGAHQQGVRGLTDILEGNLTPKLERNMRSNLPDDYQDLEGTELRDAWVSYWKDRTQA